MCFGPEDLLPLVNLHVHVIPPDIWNDYLQMIAGSSDWPQLFGKHDIHMAVVDRSRHVRLINGLQSSDVWQVVYKDVQAIVFVKHRRDQE